MVRKDTKMKDRKTLIEKATEKIKKFLTGESIDDFQEEVQKVLKVYLDAELEFAFNEKNDSLTEEEAYEHFDSVFANIIDRVIDEIVSELAYCERQFMNCPKSLNDISYDDIGLADWVKIVTDIHSKNIERKLGIYSFEFEPGTDYEEALKEVFKTLLSED